jgi:TolB-like protein/class 3 adenylate cyclase/Tfp pilus assembly protein PilF
MDRKLAAILAADVVGYSALMERDEAGTFARLKAHRTEVFEPEIKKHRGKVFKLMGDGLLAEFMSVVDAIECAVAIQKEMAKRNAGLALHERIDTRIGINLGDVIVEGKDRHGEGVNIAARLQQIADPGGICVSRTAYDQAKNKFAFEAMEPHKVKNIAEPVEAFRVKLDGVPRRRQASALSRRLVAALVVGLVIIAAVPYGIMKWQKPAGLPLPDKPSIAVLPFDNVSGDERLGRLADGMVTDITNNLSRFSELFVIARNSAFTYKGKPTDARQIGRELGVRYLLEGTVQGDQNHFRVSTQLVEAAAGRQLWSEQYDRPLKDLFTVQSEIMERVVGSIASTHGAVQQAALKEARSRAPSDLAAYDLYLIANETREKLTATDNAKAIELVRQALAKDSELEPAWVVLAQAYWNQYDYGWGDSKNALEQWRVAAQRAVELDPGDAMAHMILGLRFEFVNEYDGALREFNAALQANPNHSNALALIGGNLPWLEKSGRPVEFVERAMRLNPHNLPKIGHMSKLAYYFAGKYEKTISEIHLRDGLGMFDFMFLALAHAELGQNSEARKYATRLIEIAPEMSAETSLIVSGEFAPAAAANRALWIDGWKKSGMPMCAKPELIAEHPNFVRLPECMDQAVK